MVCCPKSILHCVCGNVFSSTIGAELLTYYIACYHIVRIIGTKYKCACKDCKAKGKLQITTPNQILPLPSHCKKRNQTLLSSKPANLDWPVCPQKPKLALTHQICWSNTLASHLGAKVQEYHVTCFFQEFLASWTDILRTSQELRWWLCKRAMTNEKPSTLSRHTTGGFLKFLGNPDHLKQHRPL